jgi:uncharacterized coiled-coil protein SlyX
MRTKKRPLLDFSAAAPAPLMVKSRIKPSPDAPDDDDLEIREQPAVLPPRTPEGGDPQALAAEMPDKPETEPQSKAIPETGKAAERAPEPVIAAPQPDPKVASAARKAPAVSQPSRPPANTGPSGGAIARIKEPAGWPIYLVAAGIAAIWALAPIAYAVGYRGQVAPLQTDPLALIVFVLLAVGPALFVMLAAFVLHQGMKLAAEARRAKALAESMLLPAALAAAETGNAVESVRGQIAEASAEAARARETMLAMQEVLAHETDRLADAAAHSSRTAHDLAETLGRQRSEMAALATTLDAQSAGVSEAITRQGRMVTEAADLAVAQIAEAEAALAARAADLAAAAGEASDAARVAGEDLSRQVARLETAGVGVSDQMRLVEEGLSEQRAGLVTVAHAMRADHEDFAAQIESRQAQLTEVIAHARFSAAELSERSSEGAEALRAVIAEAAAQLAELVDTAQTQREALDAEGARMVSATADVAAREREALAEDLQASIERLSAAAAAARDAAAGHVEAAQDRVDQLNEAAFAAAQKADAIFETRLNEARTLIAQSSELVEEASTQTLTTLSAGVAEARQTLAEMQTLLAALDERAQRLPEEAKDRAGELTAAVQKNMADLLETARKASEETQAIDAAFQERVKRNYDMLTEAAKLMGTVAGAAGNVSATNAALNLPTRAPRPERHVEPVRAPAPPAAAESLSEADFAEIGEEAEAGAAEPTPAPQRVGLGLRPRLKLTPTATDEEFREVFETAGGRAGPRAPLAKGAGGKGAEAKSAKPATDWTWKDVLSGLDGADAAADENLAEKLAGEIATMGIDPAALLPKARVDEIAAAVQTRDVQGAREVVHKLAPAAIRRLVRRMFSDAVLRGQSERFLQRYAAALDEAAESDREGFLVATLLATDAGRAYLLLDAAAGDLG